VVNVLKVLEHFAVSYDGPQISLNVSDPNAPWNNGAFSVSPSGVRQSTATDADISLSIQRLSQLVCGYCSSGFLADSGLIHVNNNKALPILDELFMPHKSYVPFMNDYF
jgi:predicted acetyltransferase